MYYELIGICHEDGEDEKVVAIFTSKKCIEKYLQKYPRVDSIIWKDIYPKKSVLYGYINHKIRKFKIPIDPK